MTIVNITLPDDVAQQAASAGLLSADAMETMLREQLRHQAADALHAMQQRLPDDELTPEASAEIVEDVHQACAELRRRSAS